jgi:hypothetical protein
MYTNIPIMEAKNIIKDVLYRDYCTKQEDKYELLNLTNTILEQNYIHSTITFINNTTD